MRSGKKLCASHPGRTPCPSKMPDSLCGTWDMVSSINFEGYMVALVESPPPMITPARMAFLTNEIPCAVIQGICPMLCKLALKVKQRKVVEQRGDVYVVKTLSSLRNHSLSFRVNEEFEEFTKGLDERHCKSLVTWEGRKLVCVQMGEKKNRGWAHWIEDDKLHLELYCEGQVCKQVFKRHD
ncbi:retinoid-binding protein 7-like [Scleropages formosus]|uniref:retinoid-binding protein 7-like n=1 Tax=Scleropages formosus TaxID=113540 RepID=UPI000878EEB3|nr:retinoid-binding protein 7-like [Scleropages formosus]